MAISELSKYGCLNSTEAPVGAVEDQLVWSIILLEASSKIMLSPVLSNCMPEY